MQPFSTSHDRRYIRPWCYIFNSKIDFCDLWVSILFIVLGIHMATISPFDKAWYYEPAQEYGLDSITSSLVFLALRNREPGKNFYTEKTELDG